jgi:DNA polymerase III alpha subunit
MYAEMPTVNSYTKPDTDIDSYDHEHQAQWNMPEKYKQLDIAEWVLSQCNVQHEIQRVGAELLLYQDRDLFDLLRYLKYLVDTMRENNIIWGVGRGSSVASYVLFLIGIHKVDSCYFDLDIEEFLKPTD